MKTTIFEFEFGSVRFQKDVWAVFKSGSVEGGELLDNNGLEKKAAFFAETRNLGTMKGKKEIFCHDGQTWGIRYVEAWDYNRILVSPVGKIWVKKGQQILHAIKNNPVQPWPRASVQ